MRKESRGLNTFRMHCISHYLLLLCYYLDSYAQQAGVRASLAQDPNWIAEYISKAMPMLTSQDNEVTYLVPWSKVESLPKDGGE